MKKILILLSMLLLPVNAWAYVPQEYPALYTHQIGRFFLLIAFVAVLAVMVKNRLYLQRGWRYSFYSVIVFILWDILVFMGRFSDLWIIGETEGWRYLHRIVVVEGWDYYLYLSRLDQLLLDLSMLLFYLGLREHRQDEHEAPVSSAYIPFLPILISDIAGTIIFIVLSSLSLLESSRLFRRDKGNALWSYMVWLSTSYLIYSLSRSFGHIVQHILIATEHSDTWQFIQPYSGSLNTVALLGVGCVSIFFIRAYQIYLKMAEQRREIERINTTLTELNEDIGTLVAERTMALMGLTVADRVRNPAFFMGGACRRMLDKGMVSGKAEETVRDMADECRKLEAIVEQFEAFFKAKRGMFKFEDLKAVITTVIDALGHEIRDRRVKIQTLLPAEDLPINMQKNLIKAAFFHVLRNSLESTQPGGTITVSAEKKEDQILVTISDNGRGIPAEAIRQIFDPFFSTKQYGFGMGLPLVRQIVTEHLGEITVESDQGKGTTVHMYFPVRWEEKAVSN